MRPQAIDLDGDNAEARVALGQLKWSYDWDWEGAEQEFQRALELNPGSFNAHLYDAWLLMALGRHSEAIREFESAERLDPLSSTLQSDFGWGLFRARRYAEAVTRFKRAIELDPRNAGAYARLGNVYAQTGKYEEALAMYATASTMNPSSSIIETAHLYALMGRRREALETVDREEGSAFGEAIVYATLGDRDRAFEALEKGVEDRSFLVFIKSDPRLDAVHSDPRWQALLRRMNFPPDHS